MYYNDEIKQKYLSEVTNNPKIKSLFSKLAKLEEQLGKDWGDFSKEESIRALSDSFDLLQINSTRSLLVQVNAYRRWYTQSNSERIELSELDFETAYRRCIFRSWDDVLSEMGSYDFHQGDETGAAIALVWLGFKLTDAVELLETQVDWKNGLIFDSKGKLIVREIDPKILRVLADYKSQTVGVRKRNHYERVSMIHTGYFLHRMDVENTVRDNEGKPVRNSTVSRKILQIGDAYESKTGIPSRLTSLNIWYSGAFRRLYEFLSATDIENDKSALYEAKKILQLPQLSVPEAKLVFESYKKAFNLG